MTAVYRVSALLTGLIMATSLLAQAPPEAGVALERWLTRIDEQRYEAAWAEAGEALQQAVTREDWVAQFQALDFETGPARNRRMVHQQRLTSLPDAPPGDYLVTLFASQFGTSLGERGEVVTLALIDNRWQPIGYFRLDELPQPPDQDTTP